MKIDELLDELDNCEDGDGQKFKFFIGDKLELNLTESDVDNLRAKIGLRHGIFVEFDSNREILHLRDNSGNIAHEGLDIQNGICNYLYARCKDYGQRTSSSMFHPEAKGCVIWLVPKNIIEGTRGFDAVRSYAATAKELLDNLGP